MADATLSSVDLVFQEGLRFEATNGGGVTTVLDSAPLGRAAGLTPMEFLLAGVGGCMAMDVVSMLRKRLQVDAYRVEVRGTRAPVHPKVYTDITIHHIITGDGISRDAVREAIDLSKEKYCSAYAMLVQSATISTTFEVRAPAAVTV